MIYTVATIHVSVDHLIIGSIPDVIAYISPYWICGCKSIEETKKNSLTHFTLMINDYTIRMNCPQEFGSTTSGGNSPTQSNIMQLGNSDCSSN